MFTTSADGDHRYIHSFLHDALPILVDLDQAGGGDLVEEHAVGVDQEMILRSRHARRDVRVHEVFPAEVRDEPVAGRDRKSTRLNSSHLGIAYAGFCLKNKLSIRLT